MRSGIRCQASKKHYYIAFKHSCTSHRRTIHTLGPACRRPRQLLQVKQALAGRGVSSEAQLYVEDLLVQVRVRGAGCV